MIDGGRGCRGRRPSRARGVAAIGGPEVNSPINDLLFTSPEGSLLRRSHFDRRVFTPAVKGVGCDPGLTFHGLHHSAVSILIAEGASIVELAAVMGW